MKYLISIFYFCSTILCAQNQFKKQIDATDITLTTINLDKISKLELKTATEGGRIELTGTAEGAYQNRVAFIFDQYATNELKISDVLQPSVTQHNDKLSAHKIYAISATISIPENLQVQLTMNSGNSIVSGNYKRLQIKADTGNINLSDLEGTVSMVTRTGTIHADLQNSDTKVITKTDNTAHLGTPEGNHIQLKSIVGRVVIVK